MGRHPSHGAPSFRFYPAEVAQMETIIREHAGCVPPREFLLSLAEKFSNSPERSGKSTIHMKQVWNWFQNRRYALRSKLVKSPGNSYMPPNPQSGVAQVRSVPPVPQQTPVSSGHNVVRNASENPPMEFEAKSARDGAWYDVQEFLSHRYLETGNPEVLVRFAGFGHEEDEWVNVRKHVRQRSLPCESSECIVVLPGDLILCFQEGKEQALYFDAHVLDAQRRRHDVRGCRCRFLVRYDHDQSEEIVPLRKVCRRPETDYRLQQLHPTNESTFASVAGDSKEPTVDAVPSNMSRVTGVHPSVAMTFPSSTIMNADAGVAHTVPAESPTPSSTLFSAANPSSSTTPITIPTPSSSTTPVSVPTPLPSSTHLSTPIPSFTSISSTTPSLTPISGPTPSLSANASLNPSLLPNFATTSSPISTHNSGPTPVSAPTQSPTLMSAATPPGPVSIQSSTLVEASESIKVESDKPDISAGEASAQKNIISPGTPSILVEVKKEDSSIPSTFTVTGSNNSQGEMSDNPTVTVPALHEPITGVRAAMEGGSIVSTGIESSNLTTSAVDNKEETGSRAVVE
ncbi:protein SAWADEE HOMEODOMAIN HOMOLOG 2-like [Amaranthus tricolor]|uniref:protein SAWADEE HOMEODOMAIN HOMOLOG 2-like n=1 Tax=Amaranthus tricolor TaxID=29722 RepID=UPI002584A574|nr:protein SAWADEE HOMEODOMAIN HOMOLOG 2-like [Amaranthus tricolor]